MRIAYVTTYDASDTRIWSGTGHHIGKTLEASGFDVVYVGPLEDRGGRGLSARRLIAKALGKRVLRERDPEVTRGYAEQVELKLRGVDVDWIFSPGTIPIADVGGVTPVAFWTDATFGQMIDLYPEFQHLADSTIKDGDRLEKRALARASVAIYASDWAANSAISDYGADPAKIRVLPFGANLPVTRTARDAEVILASRRGDLCRLLFVGVDWNRKGGDLALKIVRRLHDRGIRSELTIVGSMPAIPEDMRDLVNVVGFLSKNSPDDRATLEQLFAASHFLVLPSRAECFGVVFAEAASFAVPSIASNVGGIPSAVKDGINGFTFPLDSVVEDGADKIAELWSDSRTYDELCRSAFADAGRRLTWAAAGKALAGILGEMHPSRTVLEGRPPSATATRPVPMRQQPRVSVVTVVRNAAADIERTVKAVLSQTYENLEYIVIDGASSDGTVEIVRRYENQIDRIVSEPDSGIYDAMNKAIDMIADPEAYVMFANAGDRLHSSNAVKNAVEKGGGADVIYGKMILTDGEAAATVGRKLRSEDLATETVCHPATLMRRRLFDSVGRFDTSYKIAADYDLMVRTFQHPVNTRFVDEIISEMQMGGMSEEQFMLSCSERKQVVRAHFDFPRRVAGVWQVNLYDIPRNTARHWLARAGLLRHWRALKGASTS